MRVVDTSPLGCEESGVLIHPRAPRNGVAMHARPPEQFMTGRGERGTFGSASGDGAPQQDVMNPKPSYTHATAFCHLSSEPLLQVRELLLLPIQFVVKNLPRIVTPHLRARVLIEDREEPRPFVMEHLVTDW